MRCRWKFTHSGIMSDFAWNWFRAGQCVPLIRASITWSVHTFLFLYEPSYFLYFPSNFDLLDTASNIPRSLNQSSWTSFSLHHTIELMLPWNLQNSGVCLDTRTFEGQPFKADLVQSSLCSSSPRPSVTLTGFAFHSSIQTVIPPPAPAPNTAPHPQTLPTGLSAPTTILSASNSPATSTSAFQVTS